MDLTVKDILKRSYFQDTEVLVGTNGLNRSVKWVHIVEVKNFGHLLNGQEMILTTGVEWANDEKESLHYLRQLLDHHASALCIELNKNTDSLPKKMLELADQKDFPIILFNNEVKFINITKDIHEVLLGYQESSWWKLEGLNKEFNQTLVSNGSIDDFLKVLHLITKKQIVLIHDMEQYRFFPSPSIGIQSKLKVELGGNEKNALYYSAPIYYLNEEIAHLYIVEKQESISFFNQLAVKRCSEFLTQYFWKHRQQEEVQKVKQNEWVIDALQGKLSYGEIIKYILPQNPTAKLNEVIIGVFPDIHNPHYNKDTILTETLMSLRAVFESEGFYLFASKDNDLNCYALLLINRYENDTLYNRLKKSLAKINQLKTDTTVSKNLQWISFGKVIKDYKQLQLGYKTALSTLKYQRDIKVLTEPFYNKLKIYRLMEQIKDTDELNDIINDFLDPIISYDLEKGTELLNTLQIFLKNLGSKNKTARELFIVRQTLYHRLDKIKELLGEDYMDPQNRVMIEFAMYTLAHLKKNGIETMNADTTR